MSSGNKKEKPQKRKFHPDAWAVYVTIAGTVVGLVFTGFQVHLALTGEERARRAETLAYTLETVNTHYEYEIQQGDQVVSAPAPSLRLQVTHGSLRSITAISFDGTAFYELSELPVQEEWGNYTVDITVPPHAAIAEDGLVYDYFFLYLEPIEGQSQLDLICTTISLDTQEVRSSVFHPIALVQTGFLPDAPRREMFSAYHTLHEKLEELKLLAV